MSDGMEWETGECSKPRTHSITAKVLATGVAVTFNGDLDFESSIFGSPESSSMVTLGKVAGRWSDQWIRDSYHLIYMTVSLTVFQGSHNSSATSIKKVAIKVQTRDITMQFPAMLQDKDCDVDDLEAGIEMTV